MVNEKQVRHTFNDTRKNIVDLREILYILIKENRPLAVEEKNIFLEKLDKATLGLGSESARLWFYEKRIFIPVNNLQQFIRCFAEYDKQLVTSEFMYNITGEIYKNTFQSSDIWRQILVQLNSIFPLALQSAIHISKEREVYKVGRGTGTDEV